METIREHRLPGIGHRYDIDVPDRRVLTVVVRDDGGRELAVRRHGAETATDAVRLTAGQATAIAALLGGARFSVERADGATT